MAFLIVTGFVCYCLISLGFVNEAIMYSCITSMVGFYHSCKSNAKKKRAKLIRDEKNSKVIFFEKERELRKKLDNNVVDIRSKIKK